MHMCDYFPEGFPAELFVGDGSTVAIAALEISVQGTLPPSRNLDQVYYVLSYDGIFRLCVM